MDVEGKQTDNAKWERFGELARVYCLLIENRSVQGIDGLRVVRKSLSDLYTAAIDLPIVEDSDEPLERVSHDAWKRVYDDLTRRFNDLIYRDVFNPLKSSKDDPVIHSLADDLADIWRELTDVSFTLADSSGETNSGTRWHWRFTFEIHWGAHAIGALRAMHYILLQDS